MSVNSEDGLESYPTWCSFFVFHKSHVCGLRTQERTDAALRTSATAALGGLRGWSHENLRKDIWGRKESGWIARGSDVGPVTWREAGCIRISKMPMTRKNVKPEECTGETVQTVRCLPSNHKGPFLAPHRRQKQEDQKYKVILGYIVRSILAWAT